MDLETLLYSATSILAFSATACIVALLMRPRSWDAAIAAGLTTFFALVVGSGHLLSALHALALAAGWAACGVGAFAAASICAWRAGAIRLGGAATSLPVAKGRELYAELFSRAHPLFSFGLATAAAILAILLFIDAIIIARVAPHNWDSMTYHLARVAYYLQYGSLEWYPANYFAQTQHAKNAAILNSYFLVVSGRLESIAQVTQFLSYILIAVGVFGLARRAELPMRIAALGALLFLLCVNVAMESTTTQNDLVLLAFITVSMLAFVEAVQTGRLAWLGVFGAAFGLAIGTKASALLLVPSAAVVGLAYLIDARRNGLSVRSPASIMAAAFAAGLGGLALFAAPSGYADNLLRYGHFLGSPDVVKDHTFAGAGFADALRAGLANVARYSIDMLRPDGLPVASDRVAQGWLAIREGLATALAALGIDMAGAPSRTPYAISSDGLTPFEMTVQGLQPIVHEDYSYFGPAMALLILPAAVLGFMSRHRNVIHSGFVVAAIIFVLLQAFAGPYDSWRGRYFTALAVFAIPAALFAIRNWPDRPVMAAYLGACLVFVALSAENAVINRFNSPFPSVLRIDRAAQLTRNQVTVADAVRRFDAIVPRDATVLVVLGEDSYEYPFFGERLTRYLIPGGDWPNVDPRDRGRTPGYLLFNARIPAQACDIDLGAGYWLRDMTTCPMS